MERKTKTSAGKPKPKPRPKPPAPSVKKKPKAERFVCNQYPNLKVAAGRNMIRFVDGEYTTSDADEIKAITGLNIFGVLITPDNLDLIKT